MLKLDKFLNGGLEGSRSPHTTKSSVLIRPDVFTQIVSSSFFSLAAMFDHFFL